MCRNIRTYKQMLVFEIHEAFLTHPLLDELREYYHPNYLSQIFKQEVVLTLQDYISHVRIAATKTQLIQAISVSCM